MCLLVLWAVCKQNTYPGAREQRPSSFTTHLPQKENVCLFFALLNVVVVLKSCSASLFVFKYAKNEAKKKKKRIPTIFGDGQELPPNQ